MHHVPDAYAVRVARTTNVRAVAFDLDGTLLDTGTVVPDSYIAVIRELGGPVPTRQDVISAYRAGSADAVIAALLGRTPPPDATARYFVELERQADAVQVYSGMRAVLEQLAARLPLAVYSGASARACAILLERTRLRELFAVVLGGDEVERPKPDPEGLHLVADRLGLAAGQLAYVGDAERDARAAHACGALAILASWGHEYVPSGDNAIVVAAPEELVRVLAGG